MAYTRLSDLREIGGDFGSFVEGQMKLFSRQLAIRNAEEEVRFNEAVLAGNITLNEQLSWRQEQLKRIGATDPDENRRIREEVASLKDRIENRKFSDEYIEKLTQFNSGTTSIDSVISWLETQLSTTTDLRIKDDINEALLEQKQKRYKIQQDIIKNQTQYALNDKSDAVLQSAIDKARDARGKAQLGGDDLLVSLYDLQVQSLEKAQVENGVQTSITNFAVNTMTNGLSALGLLDSYSQELQSAPSSGNINIGGSLFGSAAEFWRYRRGQYLTDGGADGFFSRFTNERDTELGLIGAQRPVTISDIQQVTAQFDQLKQREEFRGFDFQIASAKQNSVNTGAGYIQNQILNSFLKDFDVNKAVTSLNQLKTIGANVDDTFTKIIQIGAQNKGIQVSNILKTLDENPGITLEEAIRSGSGLILSPNQLVGQSEGDIVKQQTQGAQNEQFTEDNRTTAPGVESPPVVPEVEQPPTAGATKYTFSSQFDLGTTSPEVKELQKFLNQAGYTVSESGAGSAGNETDYYGPLTQAAVQKFQKDQGIVSSGDPQSTGYGRVGPQTLEALNKYQIQ